MGDDGLFYAPEELVPLFRDRIIPRAYMITPNQFEAEKLTDIRIKDEDSAIKCIDKLHSYGPQIVVISSCKFKKDEQMYNAVIIPQHLGY